MITQKHARAVIIYTLGSLTKKRKLFQDTFLLMKINQEVVKWLVWKRFVFELKSSKNFRLFCWRINRKLKFFKDKQVHKFTDLFVIATQ